MIFLRIDSMEKDEVAGHQAEDPENRTAPHGHNIIPFLGSHIAAKEDESPAPAVGRIGEAVQDLPEDGKNEKEDRDCRQYFEQFLSFFAEKGGHPQEHHHRKPHPACITGPLGDKEHHRKLKINFRRKERLYGRKAGTGVGKEKTEHRQNQHHSHHCTSHRIQGQAAYITYNGLKIFSMPGDKQGKNIDSSKQRNHVEEIEIAYGSHRNSHSEKHRPAPGQQPVDAHYYKGHVDHRIDEIKVPCPVDYHPGRKGIREGGHQCAHPGFDIEVAAQEHKGKAGTVHLEHRDKGVADIHEPCREEDRKQREGISDDIVA